jgi:hypothetical protein
MMSGRNVKQWNFVSNQLLLFIIIIIIAVPDGKVTAKDVNDCPLEKRIDVAELFCLGCHGQHVLARVYLACVEQTTLLCCLFSCVVCFASMDAVIIEAFEFQILREV